LNRFFDNHGFFHIVDPFDMPTSFSKESILTYKILASTCVLIFAIGAARAQNVSADRTFPAPAPDSATNEQVLVLPPLVVPPSKDLVLVDAAALTAIAAKEGLPARASTEPPAPDSTDLSTAPPTALTDPSSTGRIWLGAEYLLWWTKGSRLPPLVTTGSPGTGPVGALGRPDTSVLFGGTFDDQDHSGGRFFGGLWLDPGQTFGV
jgi:hypothetical protein